MLTQAGSLGTETSSQRTNQLSTYGSHFEPCRDVVMFYHHSCQGHKRRTSLESYKWRTSYDSDIGNHSISNYRQSPNAGLSIHSPSHPLLPKFLAILTSKHCKRTARGPARRLSKPTSYKVPVVTQLGTDGLREFTIPFAVAWAELRRPVMIALNGETVIMLARPLMEETRRCSAPMNFVVC